MKQSQLNQSQLGVYLGSAYREDLTYHLAYAFRFQADTEVGRLHEAVKKVLTCHPALNVSIATDDSGEAIMEWDGKTVSDIPIKTMTDSEFEEYKKNLIRHIDVPGNGMARFEIIHAESAVWLTTVIHHIIFDGTSMRILLHDLDIAMKGGDPVKETFTCFDVAEREQAARSGAEFESQREYYSRTFGDYDSDGAVIYRDVKGETPRFSHKLFRLDTPASEFKGGSITANAAMGISLGAFMGRDDVMFTTAYHGRNTHDTDNTVTMMVRTLPVRAHVGKDVTASALIAEMKQQRDDTRAKDIFSFSDFVSMTGFEQDILFGYQGNLLNMESLCKDITPMRIDNGDTGVPLTIQMYTSEQGLDIDVIWRSDMYSEATVDRLVKTFDLVLSQLCNQTDGNKKLSEFRLVDDAAERNLKKSEVGPENIFDRNKPIEAVISETASCNPEKVAVIYSDEKLTYGDLDKMSTRIAGNLSAMGIGNGDTVGIMLPRSEWMALLPLAVLKTGAAYMPLDPTFPEERLSFMTEDALVNVVLTIDGLANRIMPNFKGKIMDGIHLASEKNDWKPTYEANLDSPMVILYTSGSTGNPKGVILSRGNILNYCHSYIGFATLTSDDRIPAYANFGFDAHMMDLYPSLMAGATLYILDEEIRHDLDALHEFYEKNRITASFLTTVIAAQLVSLYEFSTLRWLSAGGEKIPPLGKLPFYFANIYGPTECSVICSGYKTHGDIDGTVIGTPLPGYEIRILDKYLRRVPQGVPGELVILGDGVGKGYLNRPEMTAEKFVTIDGRQAYRTGDLVRWNENGEIQFMGRMDGMVKLRGLRIELGEIESVASRHEAVRQFVAVVMNIGGNDQLVGYYSVKEGSDVAPGELKEFMSGNLTEFMIPAALMKLDKLPITSNGKVDRKALPVPEMEVETEEIVLPSSPEESEVSAIVAEIIGHESFGVTTNLLKVGLTSLLAMRLVATIAKRKDIRITSKAAMADPTVRGLVNTIAAGSDTSVEKTAPKRKYYPITENQRGVLIDWEQNRDALQYNVSMVVKIKSDTDLNRLRDALAATVKAHPALSATFVSRNGDVMQQRREVVDIDVAELVFDHEPTRYEMQELVKPFNLFADRLYRFIIVRTPGGNWLFMDFHHIVFDGVSAMVFFDTLAKTYAGENVPEEEYSAFEFAADEADLMLSSEYEEAEQWFKSLLSNAETTIYPHSTTPESVYPGTLLRCNIDIDGTEIDRFCQKNAVTPSNFFLSAFMQTIHRLTRNETVAITTVNNGRNDVRLIDDIGMFVKTLPVVSKMAAAQAAKTSPADMALNLQKQFNITRGFDFYPFTEVVRLYGIRPEIMYVYEGGVSLEASEGPLGQEKIPVTLDTAKVPLSLLIYTPEPGKYRLELEYDGSLYNNTDMRMLLDMINASTTKNPTVPTVSDADLISPVAEAQLKDIREGVKGDVEFTSYHGALEMQVDLTPEALALVANDRSLTFVEFDREANRTANALQKLGVGRGDKVVILLPRTSRLITSIYGTMKTGAAYIPCDPEYPVERIKLITGDSEAKVIITTTDRLASYPDKAVDVEELLKEADTSRPGVNSDPDDPAYLIYTSGSTGRPKGVIIHHEAASNYLYGYREQIYRPMGQEEPKVNMLIVTISFDASHVDLGTSLVSGHTLVLADEEECKDVTMLANLMLRNGVEAFDATPSRLAAMLELPEFRDAISHCRLLNIGGEAIPASLITKLENAGFTGLIVNEYGPTETTVGSNHAVLESGKPVTVGRPFYNYKEFIMDAWGGELPVGGIGELIIAGRSVGKGYNNLPEKTAESYITFKGERAYRTGDLACWLPDGDVDVLGRIDHQVKLRGLRIELGEIESIANTFPGIKMSVANVCKIQNVDHLCIWYEGAEVNQEKLKLHLQRHLTDYMVPDSFNPVDKIPVTPNGKLDRKNLPAPVLEALAEYVEPAYGNETMIAQAFRKTLNLDRVGANDDFFKIGGTSINAIKVVAILSSEGLKISYKDLFETKTPRMLASKISGTPIPAADSHAACKAIAGGQFADVLGKNSVESFNEGTPQTIGNVLLTGATGYLGVHILHSLLEHTDAKVSCIVRSAKNFSASSRLRTILFYYFGQTYEDMWDNRIFIYEGDLTERNTLDAIPADSIDTVINCAASVKHFAPGDEIERANVHTVRNMAGWCTDNGKRMIHVSTVSVAGDAEMSRATELMLTEQTLDMGQGLSNQYVNSKYKAEEILLKGIQEGKLNAKIMRVGNISPRESDGEFQANFTSNAFMGQLRAYLALGCVPYDTLNVNCEFTPVDQLADAVIELGRTPSANVVFHPLNNHSVPLGDVIDAMQEVLNCRLDLVEMDEFSSRLNGMMAGESDKVSMLQPLVAYQSTDGNYAYIGCSSNFTTGILYRLGFRWSPTSAEYIRTFLTAISGLGYFDAAIE